MLLLLMCQGECGRVLGARGRAWQGVRFREHGSVLSARGRVAGCCVRMLQEEEAGRVLLLLSVMDEKGCIITCLRYRWQGDRVREVQRGV